VAVEGLDASAGGGKEAALLRVEALSRRFGGVRAVSDLTFDIRRGEIIGLIGPNGSGKSTSVGLIAGQIAPSSGRILLDGEDITRARQDKRVRAGLARTFQTTSIFPEFTAAENVLIGAHVRRSAGSVSAPVLPHSNPGGTAAGAAPGTAPGAAARNRDDVRLDDVRAILDLVGLGNAEGVAATSLSSAQQRLLMIAIALASGPRLLLLDEPAAGMVARERRELSSLIARIGAAGVAVLVIEHHMGLIMEVCDAIVVLNFGQTIATGTPAQIAANPAVIEAYLGKAH
jgi:branched-chain amino acid transport system ATP-binding protein